MKEIKLTLEEAELIRKLLRKLKAAAKFVYDQAECNEEATVAEEQLVKINRALDALGKEAKKGDTE